MQSEFLKIYCDGGSRGNPGPAASAFVVFDGGDVLLHEEAKTLGVATNNIAEYTAVLIATEWLVENHMNFESVEFYLDSLLVVNQLNGFFKIKNIKLGSIAMLIKHNIARLSGQVMFRHIRREKNTHADLLVNKALDNFQN